MSEEISCVSNFIWKFAVKDSVPGTMLIGIKAIAASKTLCLQLAGLGNQCIELKFINCTFIQVKDNDKIFNLFQKDTESYLYKFFSNLDIEETKEIKITIVLSKKGQETVFHIWNPDRVILQTNKKDKKPFSALLAMEET